MKMLLLRKQLISTKTVTRHCFSLRFFEYDKVQTFSGKTTEQKSVAPNKHPSLQNGPNLKQFLIAGKSSLIAQKNVLISPPDTVPYLTEIDYDGQGRRVFFEVYGCQMNVNDTEIVWSILKSNGYEKAETADSADIILLMTCAIREKAESKIWTRLKQLASEKRKRTTVGQNFQVGLLGCMAERLKTEVLEKEKSVDIISGPDSYKDLPRLLAITNDKQRAVNVLLSLDETYADVVPVRLNPDSVTAFVSIMRGCDNMCSYCIVPFTRGRERSRPIQSIESEVKLLAEQGCKEITLLGQNVNSYRDLSIGNNQENETKMVEGFKTVYKTKKGGIRFAELLQRVAEAVPEVRIRFTSPHPKDFPDDVLEIIKNYPNICRNIHLPIQSGNNAVLDRMRRGYTREAYLHLVANIKCTLPGVGISSDFIAGFCGETETEFADTISVMKEVKYNMAYMFAYSMREKTTAHRRYKDDVPQDTKNRRVFEMAKVHRADVELLNAAHVGSKQLILIEGESKRSSESYFGRNDTNIKVIVPANLPIMDKLSSGQWSKRLIRPGDFVVAHIDESNSQTLKGTPLFFSSISHFHNSVNASK